jgi:hypothetical protein
MQNRNKIVELRIQGKQTSDLFEKIAHYFGIEQIDHKKASIQIN